MAPILNLTLGPKLRTILILRTQVLLWKLYLCMYNYVHTSWQVFHVFIWLVVSTTYISYIYVCVIFNHVLYNDPQWGAYSPGGLEMVAAWNETSAAGLKNGWAWGALGFQPFTLHKYWHMRISQWFFLVNIFLGFATFNASGLTLGKTYYEVNHAEMNLLQLNWRLSLPAKGKNDSLQHSSPVNPCLNGFLMRQKQHMYCTMVRSGLFSGWKRKHVEDQTSIEHPRVVFWGSNFSWFNPVSMVWTPKHCVFLGEIHWNPSNVAELVESLPFLMRQEMHCFLMRVVEARNGQIIGMQDMGPPSWNKYHQFLGFGPWKEWENHVEVW